MNETNKNLELENEVVESMLEKSCNDKKESSVDLNQQFSVEQIKAKLEYQRNMRKGK